MIAASLLLSASLIGVPLALAQSHDKSAVIESGTTSKAARQLLRDGAGLYPRVARLAHNGDANGRLLAGVVSFVGESDGIGAIYESSDDGGNFEEISHVADPNAAGGKGMCCATLFELPQQVGDMPAGTLLWAASVGSEEPDRRMELRIWRSDDIGRSWEFLSSSAASPNESGLWEPEFSVASDGSLICHYSDETDPGRNQKLMQVRSRDGVNWTDHSPTVSSDNVDDRPGMAIVRKLPDGTYFMAFEICAAKGQYACVAHYRTSKDGWDWGEPSDLGTRAETQDGKYFTHTPNLGVASNPDSPSGSTVFLTGQILQNADGSTAAENGNAVFTNGENGAGKWGLMAAPVPIQDPSDQPCANFSPAILPSADGKRLFGITTDNDGEVCKPYYDTIPT